MFNKIFSVLKVILITGCIIGIVLFCAYSDTHYSRMGYIKSTNTPYLYTFNDINGNIWEFTDYDIIIPSNTAIKSEARMFTNNTTDYIEDDIILKIKILSLFEN